MRRIANKVRITDENHSYDRCGHAPMVGRTALHLHSPCGHVIHLQTTTKTERRWWCPSCREIFVTNREKEGSNA